jgi:F-type H+-transporting ATPase subunit epsilon
MADVHTFGLQVMSINGVFFDGRACSITLPCVDGEMGIQPYHEEMWVAIYTGEIRITKPNGEVVVGVCGNGSVQFANNRCLVLADTIERPEDIDVNRAKEALEIAKERMRQRNSIAEYKMSQAAMARALSRLKASKKKIGGLD